MPRKPAYRYPKRPPKLPGAVYLGTDNFGLHVYEKRIQISIRPPVVWGIKCGCDDSGRAETVAPAVKQYYPYRRLTPRRQKNGKVVDQWQGGNVVKCPGCGVLAFVANPFQEDFDPFLVEESA